MKTISKFMLLVGIVVVGFGCEHGPDTPPDTPPSGVPGIETVAGVISNEDGEVLAGIQVDVYYDEGLAHHYYAEEWNAIQIKKDTINLQKILVMWRSQLIYTL